MQDNKALLLDTESGELTEQELEHEGNPVKQFYAALQGPVVVGIEATGAMQWFLQLMEELGIECQVGHPAKIRALTLGNRSMIGGTHCCCYSC